MTEATEKVQNSQSLGLEVSNQIARIAGRRMNYTLLIWDKKSNPTPDGKLDLDFAQISSLRVDLVPVALRAVADAVEKENAKNNAATVSNK